MESLPDDDREARRRRRAGLFGALVALGYCTYTRPSTFGFPLALAASQVGLCLGFVLAWRPGDRFLSARWGVAPAPVRAGNPVFRGPSLSWYWVLALFFLALAACHHFTRELSASDPAYSAAAFLPFGSAALAWIQLKAARNWLELDVDSLQIWRHKLLFGLRRSVRVPREQIRFVAVARTASTQEFEVYAVLRGAARAIALQCHTYREEEALFQASRVGDTLMLPVLEDYRHQSIDMVLFALRREGEQALRFRRDWVGVRVPAGLAGKRSVLPPLP